MTLDLIWIGLLVFWIALFVVYIWRFLKFGSILRDLRGVLNSLGILLGQFQNIIKSGSETLTKMENFDKYVQNQKKIAEMLVEHYHIGPVNPKIIEEVEKIYSKEGE